MRDTKVFEVNLGRAISAAVGPMLKAPIPKNAESQMAALMREEIKRILFKMVNDMRADGSLPFRSGRSFNTMRYGIRVFGSSFNSMRAHILGPSYILAQEDGATITPVNAGALAIPIHSALRPDGTPKLPGPRSWGNIRKTFIYKSKKTGRSYIAYRSKEENDRLKLIYVLLEEVEIKGRGFIRRAWRDKKFEVMQAVGNIAVQEMLRLDLGPLARVKTSR